MVTSPRAARQGGAALRRRLRRGLPVAIGLVLAATLMYEHLAFVRTQEAIARDAQTNLRAVLFGPRPRADVVVVEINDLEYDTLFGGRSPLDPAVLGRLIDAIARGRPRVIGVDIETSHPGFRSLAVASSTPPIVWGRAGETLCACGVRDPLCKAPVVVRSRGAPTVSFRHCAGTETGKLVPLDFLGGRNQGGAGMVALTNDRDAMIRRYERWVTTADGSRASFAWAVARLADTALARLRPGGSGNELYIHYRPLRPDASFTAEELLRFSETPEYDALEDRVVLLGGAFSAARDRYATPLGDLTGVEIHAQIIETERGRKGVPPIGGFWLSGVLAMSSVLLLLLFDRRPFDRALREAVLFWIPLVATVASWVATGSPLALWPYLLPVLGLLVMHQMREALLDLRLETLTRPLASTRPGRDVHERDAAATG